MKERFTCAYCDETRDEEKYWNERLDENICADCKDEIEQRFKHQGGSDDA